MFPVMTSALAIGEAANMTDLQKQVIEACADKSRTAAELCEMFCITRWNVYQMARRGYLRNIGHDHGSAKYAAGEDKPKPVEPKPKKPQWTTQDAIVQATSVWHYAERLK